MEWGERSNTLASLKRYGNLTMEEIWAKGPVSMPLDQTTPTERDRIESPRPQESRLPRWPLGARFTCRISFLYARPTRKVTSPRRRRQHVVASGKQHIIGVDGVDDIEAYNNYDEMPLFIDFLKKISVVKKNLPKDILPWERKCVKGKVVTAG